MPAAQSMSKRERFLATVRGEETDHPPVWIMRQAGRYMPEYMALRTRYSFKDLCNRAEACVAASLLPQDLLGVDLLIVFNDILLPLEAMGLTVEFPEGGPKIMNPPRDEPALDRFRAVSFTRPPVAVNIAELKRRALPETPVLGFAGSPFTLLGYGVEGKMTRTHEHIRRLMLEQPKLAHEMLRRLTDTVSDYLIAQVQEGGADGVQVFESLEHILSPQDAREFSAPYTAEVIRRFKAVCPQTPVILFNKAAAAHLETMEASGADVLSVDWTLPLAEARKRTSKPLQGNLDPMVLLVPEAVESHVHRMLKGFDWRRGWIANLGHGITPQAQPEAARRFVQAVHSLESRAF